MKTIMQVSLLLFLTISFGEAFFIDDLSQARQQINGCRKAHKVSGVGAYACYDIGNIEPCLKKIVPADESDKNALDLHLHWVQNLKTQCPGFVREKLCRGGESLKCKKSLWSKQHLGDDSICNELQEVRDCLTNKLNDSCTNDIIREEMSEVDSLDHDCKNGNFNGGPCGDMTIFACNAAIFDSNKCDKADQQKASQCLADLDKKCKTDGKQKYIHRAEDTLSIICKFYNKSS